MADFSKWSRDNLESVANEMLQVLLRAKDWVERDESTHGRQFGTGNEVRKTVLRVEDIDAEATARRWE